jgi:carbon-monoxide dehydrogenase iron sulfur subunit
MRSINRRDFILKTAAVGGAAALVGMGFVRFGFTGKSAGEYRMILVDYNKCTGCRTCEVVCAAVHSSFDQNSPARYGLGNPKQSRIRVHSYNPDMDIPNVCAQCADAPCIAACPVEADDHQGNKALYRDTATGAILHDPLRCIGCGACTEACRKGVLVQNQATGQPGGACTLCGGEPACVAHCPYGALAFEETTVMDERLLLHPDRVAEQLIRENLSEWEGNVKMTSGFHGVCIACRPDGQSSKNHENF